MAWNIVGSSPSAPASPVSVTLHLGAHKTASTHLQKALSARREALGGVGCAYFGPERLRRDLKLPSLDRPLRGVQRKTAPLRAALAEVTQPRLLLSDENILGETRPPSLAQGEWLYPQAEIRLGKLLAALELEGVTVALALRDPLGLIVSGWGHQHLAGRPISFEGYCADVVPDALRWSELVVRLCAVDGVSTVLIWRHEDYSALLPEIMQRLTGVSCDLPSGQDAPLLAGPSARAMQVATQIRAERPDLDYKHALRRAMRQFPRGPDWPAPQPFGSAIQEKIRECYAEDWVELQKMARVTCLTAR